MSKQRTESLGPWQKGINNSSRDYVLPKGACLDSLNVDFTAEGYPRSRTGYGGTQARCTAPARNCKSCPHDRWHPGRVGGGMA